VICRVVIPQMAMLPARFDLWLATALAGFLRLHPQFDLGVQSAIQHNILGGFWFGAALFVCWIHAARNAQMEVQLRTLTILIGSALAVLLALLAGAVVSWPPPARYPGLAYLFPDYLRANPNTNCFPSQSTASTAPSPREFIPCIRRPAGSFGYWWLSARRFPVCTLAGIT
jgi:hypothetical protein